MVWWGVRIWGEDLRILVVLRKRADKVGEFLEWDFVNEEGKFRGVEGTGKIGGIWIMHCC